MTADDVRKLLLKRCEAAGAKMAWACAHGLSPAYVSNVLNRRTEPGKKILEALGLERILTYRKKSTKKQELSSGKEEKGEERRRQGKGAKAGRSGGKGQQEGSSAG